MKLSEIKGFQEIYNIRDIKELNELAQDIRDFLINFVLTNKGHLGSNLGVVELTIALFSYFKLNESIFLFDTGHQSHVFKLLTQGIEKFKTIRQFNGISNFQEIRESEFDWISSGHSSTSLGYQIGYAIASDKKNIISIIGNGAFLGPYTLASLLNLKKTNKKTITILNDNKEFIGENPIEINNMNSFIEALDFEYLFCEHGNDFKALFKILDQALKTEKHVFLHIITAKALGYKGEIELFKNHTIEQEINDSYSFKIAKEIEKHFKNSDFLICPAMLDSSNFTDLKKKFDSNVIDVGINEELSVLIGCAIANCQKKVIISMYSTFFQRTFDQLIHDVFRNNVPITFLIDRGGLNYGGGVSHHGIFDVSMVNNFKNSIICQPYSFNDIEIMAKMAYENNSNQFFLRYENLEAIDDKKTEDFKIGQWQELIYDQNNKISLISYGNILNNFLTYINEKELKINLINARFIKPIDKEMIKKHSKNRIFIYEQIVEGNDLASNIKKEFKNLYLEKFSFCLDRIEHGKKDLLLKKINMDVETVIRKMFEADKDARKSK